MYCRATLAMLEGSIIGVMAARDAVGPRRDVERMAREGLAQIVPAHLPCPTLNRLVGATG